MFNDLDLKLTKSYLINDFKNQIKFELNSLNDFLKSQFNVFIESYNFDNQDYDYMIYLPNNKFRYKKQLLNINHLDSKLIKLFKKSYNNHMKDNVKFIVAECLDIIFNYIIKIYYLISNKNYIIKHYARIIQQVHNTLTYTNCNNIHIDHLKYIY